MKFRITPSLVVLALFLTATQAHAIGIALEARGGAPSSGLQLGDTIVVDVFLDADGPLAQLIVAVLASPNLSYDAAASELLPIIHPAPPPQYGTTGALPGYILYSTGGLGPSTVMYPHSETTWPSVPLDQPEQEAGWGSQVQIGFSEQAFRQTTATGSNIWVASLVYEVSTATGPAAIQLAFTSSTGVYSDGDITDTVTLSGGVFVPEPTTGALIGIGVIGLAIAGRGRR